MFLMEPCGFDFDSWYLQELEFERAKQQREKKRDLIQELLADLEGKEPERKLFDVEQYFQERFDTTRSRVEQIRREVDARVEIRADFMREIDLQISYAQMSLEKFSGWGVGYNTGVDVKRNHLERQLLQLRTERRAAELRTWQDLVGLRKDLRDAMEEYRATFRLKGSSELA